MEYKETFKTQTHRLEENRLKIIRNLCFSLEKIKNIDIFFKDPISNDYYHVKYIPTFVSQPHPEGIEIIASGNYKKSDLDSCVKALGKLFS